MSPSATADAGAAHGITITQIPISSCDHNSLTIDMFQNKQELAFFPASAEKLLTHIPPFYPSERMHIFIRIASTVVLFVLLLPFALTDVLRRLRRRQLRKLLAEQEQTGIKTKEEESVKLAKTGKKNKKNGGKNEDVVPKDDEQAAIVDNVHVELPWTVWSIFNLFAVLGVITLLLLTSNNKYGARGIFQAPFLTTKECQEFVVLYDSVSKDGEPLTLDQFPKENKENMIRILNSRLAPIIERVYGIVPRALEGGNISIRINDSNNPRTNTSIDFPHLLFHVVLNDNYQGGEIKFTNRMDRTTVELRSDSGSILLFDANIDHNLLSTVGERQYVMSGEVLARLNGHVDGQHTGISHCASWLSLPWLRVFLQNCAQRNTGMLKNITEKLGYFVEAFTDLWAPHFLVLLVDKNNGGKQEEFITALDKNPIPWIVDDRQKSKWTHDAPEHEKPIDPNVVNLEF